MIFTKALKYEDITHELDKDEDVISIIGCETCVRVAGAGGQEKLVSLAKKLIEDGYNFKEGYLVPTACTPKVYFAKPHEKVNTIISLACEAGSANIERIYEDYKVIETVQDVGLMCEDAEKHVLKITLPCTDKNEHGKEYELHTGKKLEDDDNLKFKEVEA